MCQGGCVCYHVQSCLGVAFGLQSADLRCIYSSSMKSALTNKQSTVGSRAVNYPKLLLCTGFALAPYDPALTCLL